MTKLSAIACDATMPIPMSPCTTAKVHRFVDSANKGVDERDQ